MIQQFVQLYAQLVHMTSCGWWRGDGGSPLYQPPRRQIVNKIMQMVVSLEFSIYARMLALKRKKSKLVTISTIPSPQDVFAKPVLKRKKSKLVTIGTFPSPQYVFAKQHVTLLHVHKNPVLYG